MKKYLVAGLLTWLPLAITAWVLLWLIGILDGVTIALLNFLRNFTPTDWHPVIDRFAHTTGLGAIAVLVVFLITGLLVTNVAGRWWVQHWELLLTRIPVIRSIYVAVKKVSNTLFASNGQAFRKVLLVQFPREGVWTLAFLTGTPNADLQNHLQQASHDFDDAWMSVYVPTTPNPTGGYFVMMRKSQVIEVDMTVDEALTYILSMGSVAPNIRPANGVTPLLLPATTAATTDAPTS